MVFEGNRTCDKLQNWLHDLKDHVNIITDGNIQLTMNIWKPGEVSRAIEAKKIMVVGDCKFPYLDMERSHDENQNLRFCVHTKSGSKLRYLNIESSHTMACKKAVPRGISIHLAGVTSHEAGNEDRILSDIYPKTHTALKKAGYLRNNKLPKLGEILDRQMLVEAEAAKSKCRLRVRRCN